MKKSVIQYSGVFILKSKFKNVISSVCQSIYFQREICRIRVEIYMWLGHAISIQNLLRSLVDELYSFWCFAGCWVSIFHWIKMCSFLLSAVVTVISQMYLAICRQMFSEQIASFKLACTPKFLRCKKRFLFNSTFLLLFLNSFQQQNIIFKHLVQK